MVAQAVVGPSVSSETLEVPSAGQRARGPEKDLAKDPGTQAQLRLPPSPILGHMGLLVHESGQSPTLIH